MFGKLPPSMPSYIPGSSSVDACNDILMTREDMILLRKRLIKAQIQMKVNVDGHNRNDDFPIGAWAYVKKQPYRQVSLTDLKYHKLSKCFCRPYLILDKIGSVAYKLSLPPESRIHNVFHCSLLKLHEGPPPTTIEQLPPALVDNHPVVSPLVVLDFQTQMVDGIPTKFALVQWRGLLPDDTFWDSWEELCPIYDLEDNIDFDGGGIYRIRTNTHSKVPIEDNPADEKMATDARRKREGKRP